jgi:DNA-binding NarL/FixJ family response regulator
MDSDEENSELPPEQWDPETQPPQPNSYPTDLSRRELEIFRLLAMGLSNSEIAERLLLSNNTVRAHLYSIFSKIGVTSRSAAARWYQEHNPEW